MASRWLPQSLTQHLLHNEELVNVAVAREQWLAIAQLTHDAPVKSTRHHKIDDHKQHIHLSL
jgi:hypothetical protein